MANFNLRDRDAILTNEGLIFRVFGYSHPPNAYVCDAEYAPEKIYKSMNPRAPRTGKNALFYKFYDDEGWKLIFKHFPQYTLYHEMLSKKVVGVNADKIAEVRKPEQRLQQILKSDSKDKLEKTLERVLGHVIERSSLSSRNFGVFGSLLHGFHHPEYSDIDFLVYGRPAISEVRKLLEELYAEHQSGFSNEFSANSVMDGKRWRFRNYALKEFIWHQRRKDIYGLFEDEALGRTVKTEFEPVKNWSEIASEYNSKIKIDCVGWVSMTARITNDEEAPFIPSLYGITPLEILKGPREASEAARVVSYMEEFRLQAFRDEKVYIEGNLERLLTPTHTNYQVTLTYCPRYYEQVLKKVTLEA